ncbi:EF-hand domain-containing protein [Bdellovibrio svalbardensis]|uniref:EF-hand domain-containing protein n=1 Tax=Bdellovibrio svalbardensis TaxID=2972972 RepID=A0ABT6DGC0_9BACT|nr:EF-hand domain-containing protein [Bdellovibrio svalbardensis]MDG0815887.1 EF-hand domain-containing protein [Bdellovibrio svalbardensis]
MLKWTLASIAMSSVAYAGDPGTVNSGAGASAGFQGVVLSGQVTRSNLDGVNIVVTNSCFGTNLRHVTNPISPLGKVKMKLVIRDHGAEKTFIVSYPGSLVVEGGLTDARAIPAGEISNPIGLTATGAITGNVVRVNVPVASQVTVDENGNINQGSIEAELVSVSFAQVFDWTPTNADYQSGYYKLDTHHGGGNVADYRGYTGPLSASVYTSGSKDKKTYNVAAYFPGEFGFCGGYFSPLMVFFDEARPQFSANVSFPLNPTGKTMWPEAGSKGAFVAFDRDGDGKISKANELFGSEEGKFKNGFEALREFDSNKDGVIDSKDKDFAKLMLWFDKNADGISQKEELVPLKTRIKSISLKYDSSSTNGIGARAEVRERSEFVFVEKGKDKKGQEKRGQILDVWFAPNAK